jgi:hypothetical protein
VEKFPQVGTRRDLCRNWHKLAVCFHLRQIRRRWAGAGQLLDKYPEVTPSERVAIGKAIEELIGSRQGQRGQDQLVPHATQVKPGQKTREVAAKAAGFG